MTSPPANQKSVHELLTQPTGPNSTPYPATVFKSLSLKTTGCLGLLSTSCVDPLPGACRKRYVCLHYDLVSGDGRVHPRLVQ